MNMNIHRSQLQWPGPREKKAPGPHIRVGQNGRVGNSARDIIGLIGAGISGA